MVHGKSSPSSLEWLRFLNHNRVLGKRDLRVLLGLMRFLVKFLLVPTQAAHHLRTPFASTNEFARRHDRREKETSVVRRRSRLERQLQR